MRAAGKEAIGGGLSTKRVWASHRCAMGGAVMRLVATVSIPPHPACRTRAWAIMAWAIMAWAIMAWAIMVSRAVSRRRKGFAAPAYLVVLALLTIAPPAGAQAVETLVSNFATTPGGTFRGLNANN